MLLRSEQEKLLRYALPEPVIYRLEGLPVEVMSIAHFTVILTHHESEYGTPH